MTTESISIELLSTVVGGNDLGGDLGGGGLDLGGSVHGGPSLPTDGKACTPFDQRGERAAQYFSNPSPGGHGGEGGHGNGIHPDPPVRIRQPGPRAPVLMPPVVGRSDRRLKQNIQSL